MVDIFELKSRFSQTPVEKLFGEIREQAFLRVEVPEELSCKLDEYLMLAQQYCTSEWGDSSQLLYRVRRHDYGQLEKFPSREMGPPEHHQASAGRAQPVGAALLYLADCAATAVSEVKPDVGEYLTVGVFKSKAEHPLRVLDLSRFSINILDAHHRELSTLFRLSRYAFSSPVHPDDPKKYQAQAYFVQRVRDMGYDGIGYESVTRKKGRCFAFFDADKFRCSQTQIHQVLSVSVESERTRFSKVEKEYLTDQKAKQKSKRKSS